MELTLSQSEETYHEELTDWLRDNLSATERASHIETLPGDEELAARRRWERKMGAAGWLGVAWPKEFGGRGVTPMEQVIHLEALLNADAPQPMDMLGIDMVGPSVIEFGSDEQRQRILPPIQRGEAVWCQAFSEPDAGSDLASLQTKAVQDGDEWVINGHKIWSSEAHHAHWCTLLVRTDPDAPKHHGISFFMVEMSAPGITLRPIRQISGDSDFNEIFFDNVRVSRHNVLGEVNGGWLIANRFLAYERGVVTMLMLFGYQQLWDELRDFARATRRNGRPLAHDMNVRERLAASYTDIKLMRLANLRYITRYGRGETPGFETSIMKIYWAATEQRLCDLAMALGGSDALATSHSSGPGDGGWWKKYLYSRVASVYGGTLDIQRNIVAERIYGLPRA